MPSSHPPVLIPAPGVLIPVADAAFYAELFDYIEQQTSPGRTPGSVRQFGVTPRVRAHRAFWHGLAVEHARATASVAARRAGPALSPGDEITLKAAVTLAGVTRQALSIRLGKGQMTGRRDANGHWHVPLAEVIAYRDKRRGRDGTERSEGGTGGGNAGGAPGGSAGRRERAA